MALHPVTSAADLPPGTSRCFEIAGHRIAVFHTEEGFLAIDDTCPHDGGPLSQGEVNDGCVSCPWHGAEFNLSTGEVLSPPATEGVRSYRLVEADGKLSIEIE
jgi:nitrite reductase/ring-hydroxylating ferredoxin subunit